MASIKREANGKWRVSVKVGKNRPSKVFDRKADALSWANAIEFKLRNNLSDNLNISNLKDGLDINALKGDNDNLSENLQTIIEQVVCKQLENKGAINKDKYTFADAVMRYIKEVLPLKRGSKAEHLRLMMYWRLFPEFYQKNIQQITKLDIIAIRDHRSKSVSAGSVIRELTTISAVFEIARKEWDWLKHNPVHDIKKPPSPPHRERVISWKEIKAILKEMGWSPYKPIKTLSQSMACAFRLALRSGMRAGELCNMKWEHIHKNYVYLPLTKNGKSRNVPLTNKSMRIINAMKGFETEFVFALNPNSLSSLFRKYRIRAKLEDFRFHDARHTAATWMAQSLKSKNVSAQQAVMDMCKIFGWTNISQSLIYYNPTINDIVKRLE